MVRTISRRGMLAYGGTLVAGSLSGCLGSSGPDLAASEYPPGTSETGVTESQTLLDATATSLGKQGYDVSLVGPRTIESRYRSSLSSGEQLRTVTRPDQTIDIYITEEKAYAEVDGTGEPEYGRETHSKSFEQVHASNGNLGMPFGGGELLSANVLSKLRGSHSVRGILSFASFEPTAVTEQGGRSVLEFTLKEVTTSEFDAEKKNVSGSLSVDFDGVIRDAEVTVTEQTDGGTKTTRHNKFRIRTQGDVSVSMPDWVTEEFDP